MSSTTTENKIVKTAMDSVVIIGISAGVGYVGKKVLKESFLNDPSSSLTNYGKWVLVLTATMYAKQYLEDQKIIPKNM